MYIKEHSIITKESLGEEYTNLCHMVCSESYNPYPKHLEDLLCLGVDFDFKSRCLTASYYIGVDWIPKTKQTLVITPKIESVSYVKMFTHCLNCNNRAVHEAISEIYYIDIDKDFIKIRANDFEITPLLIAHFITLVKNITKNGLKQGYSFEESNISNGIKGKLLFNQQIKQNVCRQRETHNYCRYMVYNTDCKENRLLKKALLYSKRYIELLHESNNTDLFSTLKYDLSCFNSISSDISTQEIRQMHINPLYNGYAEALKIARLIIKRFGYDITSINKDADILVPPFRIDMSKLYEVYVYSKLIEQIPDIEYQASGKYGEIDFLSKSEKLLIDAKYKLIYNNLSADKEQYRNCKLGGYDIHDIRQLCGYARDKDLLKKIGVAKEDYLSYVPRCVIVYPIEKSNSSDEAFDIMHTNDSIPQFVNFYKIGISLPRQ